MSKKNRINIAELDAHTRAELVLHLLKANGEIIRAIEGVQRGAKYSPTHQIRHAKQTIDLLARKLGIQNEWDR